MSAKIRLSVFRRELLAVGEMKPANQTDHSGSGQNCSGARSRILPVSSRGTGNWGIMMRRLFPAAIWLVVINIAPALAQAPAGPQVSAKDWILQQFDNHLRANFNGSRCGGSAVQLNPVSGKAEEWNAACRTIEAAELQEVLLRQNLPVEGVSLEGVRVTGDLNMRNAEIKQQLRIVNSRFDGNVDLAGAHFGSLVLLGTRVAGRVVLDDAKIAGNLDLEGSTFERKVRMIRTEVLGSLMMNNKATFMDEVSLHYAMINGNLEMEGSNFVKLVTAENLKISRNLFLGRAQFSEKVSFPLLRVLGYLDMSGGTFTRVDLSSAVIGLELRLSGDFGVATWPLAAGAADVLLLRDVQVGTLQDLAVYPVGMDVSGLTYERLASFYTKNDDQVISEWKNWVKKANHVGSQPYAQLEKIFAAAANHDRVLEIQFIAREAERFEARANGDWGRWAWLNALRWLCGYGIGTYTFIVIPWVFGSVLLGVLVLGHVKPGNVKSVGWRIGASVDRLLPIIELNKEFGDYFNDPQRTRLAAWQVGFFSMYALWGWVLGLLLIAAMSGLTQNT